MNTHAVKGAVLVLLLNASACLSEAGEPQPLQGNASTMVSQLPLEDCTEFGCSNGCVQLDYGVDDNANGTLEASEVDGTQYICHGSDGEDGAPGEAGSDGAQGLSGEPGADGEDGPQGEPGADGEDGAAGPQGEPGTDGDDGTDGADGQDGEDGSGCTLSQTDCQATLTCEDGTSVTWQLAGCGCDNCGVCDFNDDNDCTQDCSGAWGGLAVEDNCGSCDDDVANDCVQDCAGTWGGAAVVDNCGSCDADATNDCVQDCSGAWGGLAVEDNCGTCDDDTANDCVQDCAGAWGGSALTDDCGVCDDDDSNDNTTCDQDCAGTWGGSAVVDNCGTCDPNPDNDCLQDCAGTWGGAAVEDACGTCDADASNDCIQDCAGTGGGSATTDDCGVCDDDDSNDNTTCEQDCAGTWGGTAMVDEESGECGIWTRETTLLCWQEPGTSDTVTSDTVPFLSMAGVMSQPECFQACLGYDGCNAIYQYKYSYESDSRLCWLFNQDDCYDTGELQAEVTSGWETWVWVVVDTEEPADDTEDPADDTEDPADDTEGSIISLACDFGLVCYEYSIEPGCSADLVADTEVCFNDPSATVVESCGGSSYGTLESADATCSLSTECFASDANGEYMCNLLINQ